MPPRVDDIVRQPGAECHKYFCYDRLACFSLLMECLTFPVTARKRDTDGSFDAVVKLICETCMCVCWSIHVLLITSP